VATAAGGGVEAGSIKAAEAGVEGIEAGSSIKAGEAGKAASVAARGPPIL
jgi:hypothetical protein